MLMERKLACEVENNTVSEYGIPIIAEHGASYKRYADLLGMQFGWNFKQVNDNLFRNQYGKMYTICELESQ